MTEPTPTCIIYQCPNDAVWALDWDHSAYKGDKPDWKLIHYCDEHYQGRVLSHLSRMRDVRDLRKPYKQLLAEFEEECWS